MKGAREGVRMAGKKRTPAAPEWFRPEAYLDAATLDLGDWLLNLTVRRWLHDEPAAAIEAALRTHGPLLRRGDVRQMIALGWQAYLPDTVVIEDADDFAALVTPPDLPSDVIKALRTGRVRDGINPLRVAELYLFERMLPDDLRAYAARWQPGDCLTPRDPPAFGGSLDDAFGIGPASQQVDRFVRVDLALPDDVLHADLHCYLRSERARLAEMGREEPQPYRDAARLKSRQSPAKLAQTLASIGLLPYLDLVRWQRAERRGRGQALTFPAMCEMAKIKAASRKALRGYVRRSMRQMDLHAWFARLDRSLEVKTRRRKSAATGRAGLRSKLP
jgi:hypothetical protein